MNPISLSYHFPFVLPLALVPRNRVVSARCENIPLWNETPLGYGYVIRGDKCWSQTLRLKVCVCRLRGFKWCFLYSEKRGTVVQISNVSGKIAIFLNFSIKSMVANIYVSYRTVKVILNKLFKTKILSGWSGRSVFWVPLGFKYARENSWF